MTNESEENRTCKCMNNNNYTNMNMNNFNELAFSSNGFNNNSMPEYDCGNYDENRREMMKKIKCLNFSIIELGLYLDTHPEDEKALCLHRKYCKEYRELTDKYQKVYGPLTIQYPCNKWRWLEEPWPWERGNV